MTSRPPGICFDFFIFFAFIFINFYSIKFKINLLDFQLKFNRFNYNKLILFFFVIVNVRWIRRLKNLHEPRLENIPALKMH